MLTRFVGIYKHSFYVVNQPLKFYITYFSKLTGLELPNVSVMYFHELNNEIFFIFSNQ